MTTTTLDRLAVVLLRQVPEPERVEASRACASCGESRLSLLVRNRSKPGGRARCCLACQRERTRRVQASEPSRPKVTGYALGRALATGDPAEVLSAVVGLAEHDPATGCSAWPSPSRAAEVRRLVIEALSSERVGPIRVVCAEPRCVEPDHLSWRPR